MSAGPATRIRASTYAIVSRYTAPFAAARSANASLAAEMASDPAAQKRMAELQAELDANVKVAKPKQEAPSPAALSPEEQEKKNWAMKRRHQLDLVFERFDKDGSGDIDSSELRALSKELGQEWSDNQTAEVMKEMDADGGGTVDMKELRKWFEEFDAGGGGLLGVSLRHELDKALEIGAALDDEIAAFLEDTEEEEEEKEGNEEEEAAGEPEVEEEPEAAEEEEELDEADAEFLNKPMRVSRRVVPGEAEPA